MSTVCIIYNTSALVSVPLSKHIYIPRSNNKHHATSHHANVIM